MKTCCAARAPQEKYIEENEYWHCDSFDANTRLCTACIENRYEGCLKAECAVHYVGAVRPKRTPTGKRSSPRTKDTGDAGAAADVAADVDAERAAAPKRGGSRSRGATENAKKAKKTAEENEKPAKKAKMAAKAKADAPPAQPPIPKKGNKSPNS